MKQYKYTIDEEIKLEAEDKLKLITEMQDLDDLRREKVKLEGYSKLISKAIERRMAQLDEKSATFKMQQFLKKLRAFNQTREHGLAVQLVKDMEELQLPSIEGRTLREYRFEEVEKELKILFEYFFERKDVKMIDKFLLAQSGIDDDALILKETIEIRKYKKHLKEEGPRYKKEAQYIYSQDSVLTYEIYSFMGLLGEIDFHKKPQGIEGVYRSKMFDKYLLRAVCHLYGSMHAYVYADGEYGHADRQRELFIDAHDEMYLKCEQKDVADTVV